MSANAPPPPVCILEGMLLCDVGVLTVWMRGLPAVGQDREAAEDVAGCGAVIVSVGRWQAGFSLLGVKMLSGMLVDILLSTDGAARRNEASGRLSYNWVEQVRQV